MEKQNYLPAFAAACFSLIFFSCDRTNQVLLEHPVIFKWTKSSTQYSIDKDHQIKLMRINTTDSLEEERYFYRICQTIKVFKQKACIALMDSGLDYDVRTNQKFPEICVPIRNGIVEMRRDSLLSKYQLTFDTMTNKATAGTGFIEIRWDSSISEGARQEVKEKIYLKGNESDSLILELIRRRVFKLGLWDQYYGKAPRPEYSSKLPRIYPAVVKKYKTELRRVSAD